LRTHKILVFGGYEGKPLPVSTVPAFHCVVFPNLTKHIAAGDRSTVCVARKIGVSVGDVVEIRWEGIAVEDCENR